MRGCHREATAGDPLFGGDTALIMAARSSWSEVVKLLLEKGASVKVMDKDGKTALEWALKGDNPEVLKLLKDHGAK